jgi:hypothetical protein
VPLRDQTGHWARSNIDKAKLFAAHFEKIFQPNHIVSNVVLHEPTLIPGVIKHASPREVAEVIDNLKLIKAPGHDRISPVMIRELPRKGIVFLTYLINCAIRIRYVPKAWKKAKMIVIPKAGKPPDKPSSYRPISLLSIISKIFEKIILVRLQKIIAEQALIPNIQFGFRPKHSTVEQIHRVMHKILQALENKEFAPSIFLDVSCAFDRVWHDGFIYKLQKVLGCTMDSL